ncbi:MAG: hypothetical protein IPL98_13055 [Saprospiraceae bacterium]|nr:hypothetical protein [Saprospiraceae bacterium]
MNPRITALFIFLLGYCNILYPQTSGPSSPEVQNFTPASSNNLVNVFTGDFEYNIPLMDIGGYPINISYTSNVGVEEEASCVGLGWNLNIGVINRQVRGLPDDFMGDEIRKTLNIKPKVTIAAGGGLRLEGFGIDPERFVSIGAGLSANLSFNNYSGFGIQLGSNGKINLAFPMPLTLGMGMNISSMGGNTLSGDLSLGMKQSFLQKTGLKGVGLSLSSNSINGIQNVNFNLQTISEKVNKRSDLFFSRLLDFSNKSYTPNISMPMLSLNSSFSFKGGGELFGAFLSADITVSGSIESLSETEKSTKSYGYLYSEFGDDVDALHDFIRDNDESVGPETPIIAVPIQTYDTYFASGQGFSGSFRPFRKDIGTIYDPRQFSLNVGVNISGEVGAGNAIKAGTNHDVPVYTNESRRWSQDDFIDGPNEAGSIFPLKR